MRSLFLFTTRAKAAVPSSNASLSAAFSTVSQVIDPTKIHEYKHNYDESEWALEQPELVHHMEEQIITKRSSKGKLTRIGPAANSMARLWQKTKQQSFSAREPSVRGGITLPSTSSTEPDRKAHNPVDNQKRARSWPIFHHSPPYSMSHYHVPKITKRSFGTNSGCSNRTLIEGEWAMMSGSFPSERQLKEFLESIKNHSGNGVHDISSTGDAKTRTLTIRRPSQKAH